MARKKKRIGRLPLDRLPSFMTKPSPGPPRGKALDLLMPKPKGSQQHMQPKGPKPDVQPKVRTLKVQPKVPQLDRVHEDKVSKMTTIVCWDLASDVDCYQVSNLFKDISGVIDISFTSTKHCAVLQFATAIAAQAALYQLTGCYLMGRPLKFAWFDKNGYDPNRDTLPTMEFLPARVPRTIYIKGFNSSLSIAQIRSMLKSHFGLRRLHGARIITPQNPDGTSTGKAFVRFQNNVDFVAALERDGLDLGCGRKLLVARWLEVLSFPWHQKKEGGNVGGGSRGHGDTTNWGTPSTGKRTVLD